MPPQEEIVTSINSHGRSYKYFNPKEGSFLKGHYVIFDNSSNPLASKEKATFLENAESIFEAQKSELIHLLKNIAKAEANKERNYLQSQKDKILN